LARAYRDGKLDLGGSCAQLANRDAFCKLKDQLYKKEWNVYAKKPFKGPQQVIDYFGRYTHRVAISNHRLLAMDDNGVTFLTKNGKTTTLSPLEFIRRFLLHVLPDGFVKIRHYGLMASSNATTNLELARNLLKDIAQSDTHSVEDEVDLETQKPSWQELLLSLTGLDLSVCPHCRKGRMIRRPLNWTAPCRASPITDTS